MPGEQAPRACRERNLKRFLTPWQKYDLWLQLVRQEVTMAVPAEVDRSTIVRIRQVTADSALSILAASKPGAGPRASSKSTAP